MVLADITAPTLGTETIRWYHHDQLGSTRALTDSAGALLATYAYTPFGQPAGFTGTATTPIGWAGEYRDTDTGYIYLRARHYDPTTGQFLTRDPLSVLSRDPYGYAGNNPINMIDPSGLAPGILGSIGDFFTGGGCGDGGLLGDIGDFLSENADLVHFAINLGAGYLGGTAAASLCIGTLGAGCVIFGGMAVSMILGTTAHHGAALALGEDMSLATSLRWTIQSAGAGVTGGLSRAAWGRGVATGGPLRATEGSPGLRGLLSQPFWGSTIRSRFGGWHGGLGW